MKPIRVYLIQGAIKLANGALQKFKTSAVIFSFKAVALEKLGKTDEAFEICEKIREEGTTDEQVLHTLGIIYKSKATSVLINTMQTFRAVDRMHHLTLAYEKAVEMKGNDSELLRGLFACYIRDCAFSNQQKVAMKIYRNMSHSEEYLWWVVVSIILQVWKRPSSDHAPPLGVEQTLKLTQSMIRKHIDTKKSLRSLEGLMLYVDLLYAQRQGTEVQKLLESDIAESLCKQPLELKVMQAQCYLHLKDKEKAEKTLREILQAAPDHWRCLCLLLDLFLPVKPENRFDPSATWIGLCNETCQLVSNLGVEYQNDTEASVDVDKAKQSLEFIHELLNGKEKDSNYSVPYERCSAMIDLEYVWRETENGIRDRSALVDAISRSFKTIRHLKCAPLDVKPYIELLDAEQTGNLSKAFVSEIEELIQSLNSTEDENAKADIANSLAINFEVLSTLKGIDIEEGKLRGFGKICADLSSFTYGNHIDHKDVALLASVNFLAKESFDKNVISEMGIPIWKAYILLALHSAREPFNERINLAFSAISFLLGAPDLGTRIFHRMEIKNPQVDSISFHYVFPFFKSFCRVPVLRSFLLSAWNFFTAQKADVEEMTYVAYVKGTYTKILEFVGFKERLEMSHAFHLVQCDPSMAVILSATQFDELIKAVQQVCKDLPLEKATNDFFEKLSFNEDLSVRPSWLPPFLGDHRLAVLEWWNGMNENVTEAEWKRSRISWLKISWSIPHMLQSMWLANNDRKAFEIFFRENDTDSESAFEFLKGSFEKWNQSKDRLANLHQIYKTYQCSFFLVGFLANITFSESELKESLLLDLEKAINLFSDFCERILDTAFDRLDSDISCWVKMTSVILGAMVSEELYFAIASLHFWKQHLDIHSDEPICETGNSILVTFSERLASLLERILHYLGLVNSMDLTKVVGNVMLLMEMLQNEETEDFKLDDLIRQNDVVALSQYLEKLNLDGYKKCERWDFLPNAFFEDMMRLLMDVFKENKAWAQHLYQATEKLQNALKELKLN